MARAGRKRIERDRYPNGQPKREDSRLVAHYRRVRENADKLLDPALGSPLGSLWYWKQISGAEYDAGKRFAEVRAAYEANQEGGRLSTRVQDMAGAVRGLSCAEPNDEMERRVIQKYGRARQALAIAGLQHERAVVHVCCLGEPMAPYGLDFLRVGLARLAEHFRTDVD